MIKVHYISAVVLISLLPCVALAAPYPDLYANKHLKEVGSERAQRDISSCSAAADSYLAQSGKSNSGAKNVVKQAAGGAALGALGGAIVGGKAGRGAGAGAAIGGVRGVAGNVKENREGSPEYRKYVEACLDDKGYKVVGWKAG